MKGVSECCFFFVLVLTASVGEALKKHHRHGNLWGLLVEDFEAGAHDPKKFEASCTALIGKLLPDLRREYTSRQVPTVLYHECDVYKTRDDFHKKNQTVEVATWQCRHFAGSLVGEFLGQKDYKGWCMSFFDYLQERVKSPKEREDERVRLMREKQALQHELDDLHMQWKRERGLLAAKGAEAWRKSEEREQASIAKELDHLSKELKGGGGKGKSGFDDADANKLDAELDSLEDEWGLDEEGDGEAEEALLPCCPSNCRICHANQTKPAAVKDKAKKKSAKAPAFVQLRGVPQTHKLAAVEQRVNQTGVGFFGAVVTAFTKLPEKPKFIERCGKIISVLMPKLQREYTWRNVPNVLNHDCDVFTTTTDFKLEHMTLEHASWTCKHFAGQLSAIQGKNASYPTWCGDVFAFLTKAQSKKDEKSVRQLLKEKHAIQKQINDLNHQLKQTIGMPCCPNNCRDCS